MKALAFDLWETLITDTPEIALRQQVRRLEAIGSILREQGLPSAPAAIETAYRAAWSRCHELYWARDRDVPARRQVLHMLEHLAPGRVLDEPVLARIEDAYTGAAAVDLPELVDGAAELIPALAARFPLGLISNTGRTPGSVLRRVLDLLHLGPAFRVMVFSDEHGECKPVGSIFRRMLTGLGVEPHETVFVGDNLYSDVWGAKQAGMRAVHFDPPVRGHAVGPATREVGPVEPDARIRSLRELPRVIEEWSR